MYHDEVANKVLLWKHGGEEVVQTKHFERSLRRPPGSVAPTYQTLEEELMEGIHHVICYQVSKVSKYLL